MQTSYKNNRQVTLLTGANGPGDQDVWMSGYLDGACDIILGPPGGGLKAGSCTSGKISYLGGHNYGDQVPVTFTVLSFCSPSKYLSWRLKV